MSGLSTSIAAALGEQAEEVKRQFSTQRREDLAKQGEAMPDGSYPIANEADLKNAIQSFGRAKDPEAVKAHIIKRARALGAMNLLPESWNVTKDDEPETIEWKSDGRHETKVMPVTGLKVLDDSDGIVEAYVSVTGIVDRVKDIIEPGAYEKTLAERVPKGVWSHDWASPVSKTLEVKELLPGDPELPRTLRTGEPWPKEAGALKVKMQFNLDGERGRQAYADVKFFGDEQEWSIGYNVPVGGAVVERKSGIRRIKTMDLFEFSPVLFGAMPDAVTASGVKSAQEALRLLREAETKDDAQLTIDETEVVEDTVAEPEEPETEPETEPEAEETEEVEEEDDETDDGISDEQLQLLFDDAAAVIDAEVRAIMEKVAGQAVTPSDNAAAERLRVYWSEGEGAAKIRWGTPGDWKRCERHLAKYMGPRAKGYCQLLHKRSTGIYTGDAANPGGNGKADEPEIEMKEVDSSEFLTCQKCGGTAVEMVEGKAQCKACGGKVTRKYGTGNKAAPASAAQMLRDLADAIEGGEDVDRASVESVIKALQSTLNSTQKEPDAEPEEPEPEETKVDEGVNIIGDVFAAARFAIDLPEEVMLPFPLSPEEGKDWDPRKHPRVPGGHENGGRFTSLGALANAIREAGEVKPKKKPIPAPDLPEAVTMPPESWTNIKHGPGRPDGTGTESDPINCGDDLDKAVELLAQGKHIRLDQPDQVSVMVRRMDEMAKVYNRRREAAKKAKDAADNEDERRKWEAEEEKYQIPDFNLCLITVPNTNLFCHDHKGIPRKKMPQLSGEPKPGSPADKMKRDPNGNWVDLTTAFRAALTKRGIKVSEKTVPASHLRSTQSELIGDKVGDTAGKIERNEFGTNPPIMVTRDGYIIDGHHRWAAQIVLDLADGKLGDVKMNVEVVDMDIGEALDLVNTYCDEMGIQHAGTGAQRQAITEEKPKT